MCQCVKTKSEKKNGRNHRVCLLYSCSQISHLQNCMDTTYWTVFKSSKSSIRVNFLGLPGCLLSTHGLFTVDEGLGLAIMCCGTLTANDKFDVCFFFSTFVFQVSKNFIKNWNAHDQQFICILNTAEEWSK